MQQPRKLIQMAMEAEHGRRIDKRQHSKGLGCEMAWAAVYGRSSGTLHRWGFRLLVLPLTGHHCCLWFLGRIQLDCVLNY